MDDTRIDGSRFFRWLYRVLAIVALCALLAIGYAAASIAYQQSRWADRRSVTVVTPGDTKNQPKQDLRFTALDSIAGTTTSVLQVETASTGGGGSLSSAGYGGSLRNLVFLDGDKTAARWLYNGNLQLLSGFKKLCLCDANRQAPVLALYVEVRASDTNGDGTIDEDDDVVPAMMRTDGRGYTTLSTPVDRIIDSSLSATGDSLEVLIQEGSRLTFRRYAIPGFNEVANQLVTDIDAADRR